MGAAATNGGQRPRPARRRGFDDDNFYSGAPPPSFAGLGASQVAPETTARVKWCNADKGFGFVELTDGSGDVFLHTTALRPIGIDAVSPGATLQVRVGKGQKGRQVDKVVPVDESTAEAEPPRRAAGHQQRPGAIRPVVRQT